MEYTKILVLGEPGVGKTSYIRNMTRESEDNKIDEIASNELNQVGIQKAIQKQLLSTDVINFMVYYGFEVFIKSNNITIPNNMILPALEFEEINYPLENDMDIDISKYDNIILMCEFTDINSIRSMFCFVEKYKLPRKNTIICVNKCDCETEYKDINMERIYKVLKDFSIYPIEFVSVNTEFNVEFIYKYI